MAATVKGKQALLDQAMAELKVRENGIIKADTAAQAQAQFMDLIHRVAAANGFDARGAEQLTEARPLGADYGAGFGDGDVHLRDRPAREFSGGPGQRTRTSCTPTTCTSAGAAIRRRT